MVYPGGLSGLSAVSAGLMLQPHSISRRITTNRMVLLARRMPSACRPRGFGRQIATATRATSDVLAASPEQSPKTPVSSNLRPLTTTTKMGASFDGDEMEEEGDDDDGETTS